MFQSGGKGRTDGVRPASTAPAEEKSPTVTSRSSRIDALRAWSARHREAFRLAYPGRLGAILLALIAIDLSISVWNAAAFEPGLQYDADDHAGRIATCGVYTDGRYYNPPLYYALACPVLLINLAGQVDLIGDIAQPLMSGASFDEVIDIVRPKIRRVELVDQAAGPFLQFVNVAMLATIYFLWIVKLFPRYLGAGWPAFLASALLLALPGFQKVMPMTNPDNMLAFATTVCFYAFVKLMDAPRIGLTAIAWFGVLIGALGLTRPFAVVPMLCIGLALAAHLWRRAEFSLAWPRLGPAVAKLALFGVIAGAVSGSWWVYRHVVTGDAFTLYGAESVYYQEYQSRRAEFDYGKYYTTFHYGELLKTPNRNIGGYDPEDPDWRKSLNNSFATLFFSDYWADHWLYFSGPSPLGADENVAFKRAMLVYALPISILLLTAIGVGLVRMAAAPPVPRRPEEIWTLIGVGVLGMALYVYWQSGQPLEPGKNSAVKFIYTAFTAPFLITPAFAPRWPRPVQLAAAAAILALFALAIPLSIYRW